MSATSRIRTSAGSVPAVSMQRKRGDKVNRLARTFFVTVTVLAFVVCDTAQTRNFTPVEGPNLKARIENAITAGRGNAPGGRVTCPL